MKLNDVVTRVARQVRDFLAPGEPPTDPPVEVELEVPAPQQDEEDDWRLGWIDQNDPQGIPRDLLTGRPLGRGGRRRRRSGGWTQRWRNDS